jgi:hypothetical protein
LADQKSTPSISEEIERVIKKTMLLRISIPKINEIRNFLTQYIGLCETVLNVSQQAVLAFPLPSRLSIELYRDPEIEDSQLTLYIRQPNYDLDIMDQIDAFRDRLYAENQDCFNNLFVTTDFQLPW